MELRHLRYFVAVAEDHGFVRAADRLRIAQPALSRQIRNLEREVGMRLVEREPRAVHLTPGGEAVLVAARAILEETTHAIERARRSSRGLAGQCSVCAGKLPTWNGVVARLIAAVRRDFPLVALDVTEGVGEIQWRAVRSGQSDLGIGMAPTREYADLEREQLMVQGFDAALVTSNHRLCDRTGVRVAELAKDAIVAVLGPESDHHRMCLEVANRATPPTPIRRAETIADLFAQIAMGIAWTPFVRALAPWAPPGTAVVPLEDLDVSMAQYVIWKRGGMAGVVRTVRDSLLAVVRESPNDASSSASRHASPRRPARAAPEPAPNVAVPLGLELRHLRYFLTVTEERSVGRAARQLSITQPTLSRQMQDLERVVGVTLLERNAKGVVPTAAGAALAADARQILELAAGLGPEAHRASRGALGRCLVATIPPMVVGRLIAAVLRDAVDEMPEIHVGLVEIPTPQQPEALMSGRVDLGICNAFTSVTPFLSRIQSVRLLEDPVRCALVPPDSPLAGRSEIALSELADVPFLFMSRSLYPSFYDQVMTVFAAQHFHPRIEQPYDGLQTTWSLARRGEGWCIGFRSNLRFPPAGLVGVPVRGLDLPWGIEMLHRRDENRGGVLRLMALVRRRAAAEATRWPPVEIPLGRGDLRSSPETSVSPPGRV